MQAMDRQYLDTPFYGSRRMKVWLAREGRRVSRKRVQRSMRIMGCGPSTGVPGPVGLRRSTGCIPAGLLNVSNGDLDQLGLPDC